MSRILALLVVLATPIVIWPSALPAADEGTYHLNPGDVLQISVWKEEGMEKDVLVLPDGTISFPLAGHMTAAGKTAGALKDEIRQRLAKFFADPVVTVAVLDVSGNKVFVMGEVNSPGEFLAARALDVVQALSLAGGFTEFASESRIKVLRREGGKQVAIAVDYPAIQSGQELDTNILLQSGDIVVVPTQGLF